MNEKYEQDKQERIAAAQKFAKELDNLFKEFYKNHKPPFFIGINNNIAIPDKYSIRVHNNLYKVYLMDVVNDVPMINLRE